MRAKYLKEEQKINEQNNTNFWKDFLVIQQ